MGNAPGTGRTPRSTPRHPLANIVLALLPILLTRVAAAVFSAVANPVEGTFPAVAVYGGAVLAFACALLLVQLTGIVREARARR